MKKSILTIVTVIVLGLTNVFADSLDRANQKVQKQFEKEYVNAKEVSWESHATYYKVTFVHVDQVMTAYYAPDGTRIAVSRNISSSKLPLKLQTEIKQMLQRHWISDLFEFYSEEESGYYITVENGSEKIVYRSLESGGWEMFSREAK